MKNKFIDMENGLIEKLQDYENDFGIEYIFDIIQFIFYLN